MKRLFIVATPIGNLKDITIRGLEVLKNVDLIISEDTRETEKLLKKYEIKKSQISYRDQNHNRVFPKILDLLDKSDAALISDSGTPLISDPGFKLVSELISKGIEIVSIPGPSAVISSIVASGLPTDKFSFLGFLPKKQSKRSEILRNFGDLDCTLIIYESPYRISKLLDEIFENLGERYICIVNEQTKKFEKIYRGLISKFLDNKTLDKIEISKKGEFVVLVAKKGFKDGQ